MNHPEDNCYFVARKTIATLLWNTIATTSIFFSMRSCQQTFITVVLFLFNLANVIAK